MVMREMVCTDRFATQFGQRGWSGVGVTGATMAGRRAGTLAGIMDAYVSGTWLPATKALPFVFGGPSTTYGVDYSVDGTVTVWMGFAWYYQSNNANYEPYFQWINAAGQPVFIMQYLGGGATPQILRADTYDVLANGINRVTTPGWHYLEFACTCSSDGSNSRVQWYADGLLVADTGSIPPSSFGSRLTNMKYFQLAAYPFQPNSGVQDLYILDSTGGVNNNRLGDIRVEKLTPTADVAQGWPLNTGTVHNTAVDSNDGDATYVTSTGDPELYTMSDLVSTVGTVKAVQAMSISKKVSGSGNLGGLVRISGVDHAFPRGTPPGNGVYYHALGMADVNPATGVAWTAAELNALVAGPKVL